MATGSLHRAVFAFLVLPCAAVWAEPPAAVDPTGGPRPEAAVPSTPPGPVGGDSSKLECVKRHEDAQLARGQDRLLDARAALRLCSRAACPAAIRDDCVDWLAEVTRSLPSVVVTARESRPDVADVKVFVDGKLVAERLSGAALELDPGEHRFRFESPRWPPVERTVLVSEGVKNRPIEIEFTPAPSVALPAAAAPSALATPSPTPAATPGRRWPPLEYVVEGVGIASLATFATFGGIGLYEHHRLEGSCAPFCGTAEVSRVRTEFIVADASLGVALVSAAIAVYLHRTRPSDAHPTAASSPSGFALLVDADQDRAGIGVRGSF